MKDKHLAQLLDWLQIPSISSDPLHRADIQRAAEWVRAKLESIGFEATTLETDFLPVVFGQKLDAGPDKPTVLIYGHYDVQSPEPLNEWKSEPFKPEIRNGNIYSRGAADDKGQLYTWIAAIEELLSQTRKLPVNVKVLIEGAEEEGSRGLQSFVNNNQKLLKADFCALSDSHSLSPNQPLITYGLRGLSYWQIELKALKQDVHSGIYGGNVVNVAQVLARILCQLKDEHGKILIPGFYDQVRQLSATEIRELNQLPWTEEDISNETGATCVVGEAEFSIATRAGARPTLDINGLWSGYQGEGSKTIIPAKAGAKISMRLVPYQNSKDIARKFAKYIKSLVPQGIEVAVKEFHGAEPVLLDRSGYYFQAAQQAYEKVFKTKPLYELSGGSIGVVADFKQILGIDSVMMGYGLPDDNLHGPNEKLSLEMFEKGIETNKVFLQLLGSLK